MIDRAEEGKSGINRIWQDRESHRLTGYGRIGKVRD